MFENSASLNTQQIHHLYEESLVPTKSRPPARLEGLKTLKTPLDLQGHFMTAPKALDRTGVF
jgi:hypothetical protein